MVREVWWSRDEGAGGDEGRKSGEAPPPRPGAALSSETTALQQKRPSSHGDEEALGRHSQAPSSLPPTPLEHLAPSPLLQEAS